MVLSGWPSDWRRLHDSLLPEPEPDPDLSKQGPTGRVSDRLQVRFVFLGERDRGHHADYGRPDREQRYSVLPERLDHAQDQAALAAQQGLRYHHRAAGV